MNADHPLLTAPDLRSVLAALGLDGHGWVPSAAALFDLFAGRTAPGPARPLAGAFDVVAAPAAAPAAVPAKYGEEHTTDLIVEVSSGKDLTIELK